jgi:hypothetical protein
MPGATTKTDATDGWAISDDVIRLREGGTDRVHMLPAAPTSECTIGSAEDCSLRLADPRVSRRHARLRRLQGRWAIYDLGSKNGVRRDGAPHSEPFFLEPGVEIGIGGVVLIAESGRWIALRSFCARILGWSTDQASTVDGVLRTIRLAARQRAALLLCGGSDMVPLAYALHRHTHGDDRPFIVCDPRRRNGGASIRSAANHEVGMVAVEAARGGTLCVRSERLPDDFGQVLVRIRQPDARVRLVVCARTYDACTAAVTTPIRVPALSERASELPRIVDEYMLDAIAALQAPATTLGCAERAWILENAATTLPEIEKAALRLVALRTSRSINRAASRLGMAPISLSRWIERRRPPARDRRGGDDASPHGD